MRSLNVFYSSAASSPPCPAPLSAESRRSAPRQTAELEHGLAATASPDPPAPSPPAHQATHSAAESKTSGGKKRCVYWYTATTPERCSVKTFQGTARFSGRSRKSGKGWNLKAWLDSMGILRSEWYAKKQSDIMIFRYITMALVLFFFFFLRTTNICNLTPKGKLNVNLFIFSNFINKVYPRANQETLDGRWDYILDVQGTMYTPVCSIG